MSYLFFRSSFFGGLSPPLYEYCLVMLLVSKIALSAGVLRGSASRADRCYVLAYCAPPPVYLTTTTAPHFSVPTLCASLLKLHLHSLLFISPKTKKTTSKVRHGRKNLRKRQTKLRTKYVKNTEQGGKKY